MRAWVREREGEREREREGKNPPARPAAAQALPCLRIAPPIYLCLSLSLSPESVPVPADRAAYLF